MSATLPEMMKDFSLSCIACNECDHEPIDDWAWYASYKLGYREPNYPMPAIRYYVAWSEERNKLITLRWWK